MTFKFPQRGPFPKTDRFHFLRLMKALQDLAANREDYRLADSAQECLSRLTETKGGCSLASLFTNDFRDTGLPPAIGFSRSEVLAAEPFAPPARLLQILFDHVQHQAKTANDTAYLNCVESCKAINESGSSECPFHWVAR